jgi:hypothetical protein
MVFMGAAADDRFPFNPGEIADLSCALYVGNHKVALGEGYLQIGSERFDLLGIQADAAEGENLVLEDGGRLQAALALVVIAALERDRG